MMQRGGGAAASANVASDLGNVGLGDLQVNESWHFLHCPVHSYNMPVAKESVGTLYPNSRKADCSASSSWSKRNGTNIATTAQNAQREEPWKVATTVERFDCSLYMHQLRFIVRLHRTSSIDGAFAVKVGKCRAPSDDYDDNGSGINHKTFDNEDGTIGARAFRGTDASLSITILALSCLCRRPPPL
jgi:hypothetical protein